MKKAEMASVMPTGPLGGRWLRLHWLRLHWLRLSWLRRNFAAMAVSCGWWLLLAAVSSAAIAQANVLDLRLAEFDSDGHRTYQNAIFSHTFGESRFSLEAFWLFLPQFDNYDEPGLGLGYRLFERGDLSVSLLGYFAAAPDDDYFEPALLAMDTGGGWTWSLFLLRYVPMGSDGIGQWLVDPFEIQYQVKGPVSVGLSAYLYRPDGGSWLRKIGPKVSLADRWGATELAVRDVRQTGLDSELEFQIRRLFSF